MTASDLDVLVVGDGFIPARSYEDAFAERDTPPAVRVRSVEWAGGKAHHHELQQVMEQRGANAVPAPIEVLAAVPGAQALCLHFAPVSKEVLEAADSLRLVSVARAGLENVDIDAATSAGIGVVPAHGRNAGAVAELQLALMLAEARNIARADASIKQGGWRKEFPGARIEVARRTIGMIGFGHVGQAFASRLAGFGATLLTYDPYSPEDVLVAHGVRRVERIEEVFERSDFVVVQARLTPQTERFITAEHFRLMRPHAYFVNVARSRVVDYDALYDALASGSIAGAGLDVFDEEPLPRDSRWRALDNVTLTTHFGGDTEDTNRTSAGLVADAVLEFARTGRVVRAVNAAELGWS